MSRIYRKLGKLIQPEDLNNVKMEESKKNEVQIPVVQGFIKSMEMTQHPMPIDYHNGMLEEYNTRAEFSLHIVGVATPENMHLLHQLAHNGQIEIQAVGAAEKKQIKMEVQAQQRIDVEDMKPGQIIQNFLDNVAECEKAQDPLQALRTRVLEFDLK